jgi:acyl-CoA reductase-like NAD-dependent aldehyde dehydrogenase
MAEANSLVHDYQLYIDGQWVDATRNSPVEDINPATGALYARVQQAGLPEVERAIAAAHRARVPWGESLVEEREGALLRAADILSQRRVEVVDRLIDESGSTFGKSMFEVSYVVDLLRSAAGECRRIFGETLPMTLPGQFGLTIRRPLGVIAGISPFNAPFLLAMKKVALALAAGNTFVLKPSEETPVIGLTIAEIFEAAGVPAGVINVIPGPGPELGQMLVADPRVRMVTFTGSTKVGRHLAVEAARHLKRFTLEMGGKNPLIVLKDADLDYAVDAASFGIYFHQGQVCMANSKVIVEQPLFDAFAAKFVAKTRTVKVGDPRAPDTVIGPLIRRGQCGFIDEQIKDAVSRGARLLTGGEHQGNFYQPTVLADVTPDMRIFHEESFGPVVSLLAARDAEDALSIANDTSYGLSSAVITNDLQQALNFALRLEAGMVHVNDCTVADEPHVPFGGIKNSGFGREGGSYSIADMTELKWITFQQGKRLFPF